MPGPLIAIERLQRLHDGGPAGPGHGNVQPIEPDGLPAVDQIEAGIQFNRTKEIQ